MNSHLAALRESIIAETLSIYPDFHFFFSPDKDGNLTVDYRRTWEPAPDPHDTPCLTIEHDGDRFLVSHYRYGERKKYKTLKGAAKYVNDELHGICDRNREHKAKADAEREHREKSIRLLRDFHGKLTSCGLNSKLCLKADRYNFDHVSVEADRINIRFDIVITHDYRLEIVPAYSRFYAAPETAIDIFSVMSTKGTA